MSSPYVGDKLDCDIVMKGGITSGVVYPGAATELATRYRFRSIGGTSAGAIAAAIVAAAEHRRRRGRMDGFEALEGLADELAGEPGGEPLLLKLFQPDKATQPLFKIMMSFMKRPKPVLLGAPAVLFGVLAAFPTFPAIAAAIIATCLTLAFAAGLSPVVAGLGIFAAVLLFVAGLLTEIVRTVLRLPANGFGICTLGPGSVGPGPALTEWLHHQIQTIAYGDCDEDRNRRVLTIADLWGVTTDPARRQADMLARSRDPELREIDLQMMTTDLTHGRPWRLPALHRRYDDALEPDGELLFKPEELVKLFPPSVVEHMKTYGGPVSDEVRACLPKKDNEDKDDFWCFPIGPDLPVLVATRMSLSFPGLICAIPLWRLDRINTSQGRLKRVLFSDGGITSNFPVHFFDAPLPRRPTFGLHLTTFPAGMTPPEGLNNQAPAIVAPVGPAVPAPEEPRDIYTLSQFFVAIKDAMQNWRDNTQARQPGFRDRMVHIRLGKGEGGMTLTMDRDKVIDLSARGGEAAKVLVALFAQPDASPCTRWNEHRFVRFRIATAVTEQYLASFSATYRNQNPADGISMSYPKRVDVARPQGIGPYCFTSKAQMRRAKRMARAYNKPLPDERGLEQGNGAPRPPSVLRILPPT
jgi:predicted acylesterase/phospholipase RssA